MVPALALFFSWEIKKAVGTSLAAIVPASFVGVAAHYFIKSGNIKFFISLFIIAGAVLGSKAGVRLANNMSGRILRALFALFLLFIGLKLIGIIYIPTQAVSNISVYPVLTALGLIAGLTSALFGIGGGAILVPALNLFFGLTMHEAIATSLTVIVPTAFAGAVFHKEFGNINIGTLKFLVPAALIGAICGAVVTNNLPSAALKIIFGTFMVLCSIRLFLQRC